MLAKICFAVDAIIFLAPISAFDQVLVEVCLIVVLWTAQIDYGVAS